MTPEQMRHLARRGAALRLAEITAEITAIGRAFPSVLPRRAASAMAPSAPPKRYAMSKAQRAAVSKRMRAYWRARRRES